MMLVPDWYFCLIAQKDGVFFKDIFVHLRNAPRHLFQG